jgi:pimeloyl-ACP methyl ester carboxylesterase
VRWAGITLIAVPLLLSLATILAAAWEAKQTALFLRHVLRYTLLAEISLVLVLAISGLVYERASQARDLRFYPPCGRLIDIGGYRLHLYCTGAGSPTVILEHGLDGSYLDWRLVQPEIARFARVCSYDRAGYGWSEPSRKPRFPSVMVEELHSLLNQAGEKPPFILVAHSMGAFNAQMYAHRYPSEVAAIVLVDGSNADELMPFPWKEKLALRGLEFTAPFGLPRWRKWCAGSNEALQGLKAAVDCKAKVFRTHYQQWQAFPEAAAEIRALGKSLSVPITVISRDPNQAGDSPREQHWMELQKKLLQLSPHSRQVMAEGSGHGIPGQRPDVIVDVVRDLIEHRSPAHPNPAQVGLPASTEGRSSAN